MEIPNSPAPIGSCVWFPELNFGRGKEDSIFPTDIRKLSGEDKTLTYSLARNLAWLAVYPAITRDITKSLVDRAVEEREATLLVARKATKTLEEQVRLAVLENRYLDSKGKVIRPCMLGLTGNRRSQAIDLAYIIALTSNEDGLPGEASRKAGESVEAWVKRMCSFELPFVYNARIKTEADARLAQVEENELKDEGSKAVSVLQNLENVRFLLSSGKRQSDVIAVLGSKGQKLTGIVTLDLQVPDLKLVERLKISDSKDVRYVPYRKLPTSLTPVLAATSPLDSEYATYVARQEKEKKTPLPRMRKVAEVESWLQKTINEGPAPSMMKQDDVKNLAKVHSGNPLVTDTIESILTGVTSHIAYAGDLTPSVRILKQIREENAEQFKAITDLLLDIGGTAVADRKIPSLSKASAKKTA